MKVLSLIIVGVLVGLLGFSAYVRLAPSDPVVWHKMPKGLKTGNFINSAVREIEGNAAVFETLNQVIASSDRTAVLAGSLEEGMVTYVTRSALMKYPDYTTIKLLDGKILLYGRARFGRKDFGANTQRIDAWLAQL